MQLVELGPGRGTLTQDVLRVLSRFGLSADLSVHLVEISPHLSEMQSQRLCFQTAESAPTESHYRQGETVSGIPVRWYERVQDVPNDGFSVVLAHEFFDALPVHKFQKITDDKGEECWRELLIEVGESGEFRMVAARKETPLLKLFEKTIEPTDRRQHIERSFETMQMIEHISVRLEEHGGFALIMDYGHGGNGTDTFRAFKRHRLHDPLVEPGTADLTADVDFGDVKRIADGRLCTFGPIEQREFLQRMGGRERLQQLIEDAAADAEAVATLKSGYEMLTSPEQMGTRFKFFAMFPAVLREHLAKFPVGGFK